jgi:UPF0755 protein
MDFNFEENTIERRNLWSRLSLRQKISAVAAVAVLLCALIFHIFSSPEAFPVKSIVQIEQGQTLGGAAEYLKENGVIKYPFVLRSIIIMMGGERSIAGGDYYFGERIGVIEVAKRILKGDYRVEPIKVTIPEGTSAFEISKILMQRLGSSFKFDEFARLAQPYEGYLFPDTYFMLPTAKPQGIVDHMKENFDVKVKTIEKAIADFGEPLADVIIMASIIEEEAVDTESRKIVSGILWKRLSIGMPLQVDASFQYVNGKASLELTTDDLKIDSPYNTYKYKGLPPGPISNPGLDSILAAVTPTKTSYLYFLSDKKGKMYYSATFEEHVRNKEKYLR